MPNPLKGKNCLLPYSTVVACTVLVLLICFFKGRRSTVRRLDLREPYVIFVKYQRNKPKGHLLEFVGTAKLSEIPTVESNENNSAPKTAPLRHSLQIGDKKAMIVVPVKYGQEQVSGTKGIGTGKYRINIFCGGEHFIIDNVEYSGEEFLNVSHGNDWYVAFTRRL